MTFRGFASVCASAAAELPTIPCKTCLRFIMRNTSFGIRNHGNPESSGARMIGVKIDPPPRPAVC